MKIELWSIGSPSPGHLQKVEEEYLKRLQPMARVSFEIIRNAKIRARDKKVIKREESRLIRDKLKKRSAQVILLDEKGSTMTSIQFSNLLKKHMNHRSQDLIFIIGGAYGFDPSVEQLSNMKMSLSKLTFPHQLVRSIFLEQLYRGFSILHRTPYHHQ